jgi:hypothetical protein
MISLPQLFIFVEKKTDRGRGVRPVGLHDATSTIFRFIYFFPGNK